MIARKQSEFLRRWEPTELAVTILSRPSREVVNHWITALAFLDEHQHPVVLDSNSGVEPGFSQLVQAVDTGYVPSVILNELLRKGVVEQLGAGQVLLRRSTYVHDLRGPALPPSARGTLPTRRVTLGRRRNDDL